MVGAPAYGQLRPGAERRAARRLAAGRTYNFVFIHIPKTGGTSIRDALGIWSLTNHLTAREMRQMYPDSVGKFTFTFVRNPWDLIVSYAHTLRGRRQKNVWDHPESFGHFVLRPQVDYIMDDAGKPMVDFIGRFETIEQDFNTICGKLGVPTPPLPHLNASRHCQYREYYNDAARQFIAQEYAEDIERFGYTF